MISQTCLNKIQKFQDKCMCLIDRSISMLGIKYSLNRILQIKDILFLENCKIRYKLKNKQLPVNIHTTLTTDHNTKTLTKLHKYNTRYKNIPNNHMVKVKQYNKSFLSTSLRDTQPFMFITQCLRNIKHFTNQIRKELLNNY